MGGGRTKAVAATFSSGVGLIAALLLHRHGFAWWQAWARRHGFDRYASPTLRLWKDPVAVGLAAGGVAVGLAILSASLRRVALSLAALGVALGLAVYVHQRTMYLHSPCPPGSLCLLELERPSWWLDGASLQTALLGAVVASALLVWQLPRPDLFGPAWQANLASRLSFGVALCAGGLYVMSLGTRFGALDGIVAVVVLLRAVTYRIRRPRPA